MTYKFPIGTRVEIIDPGLRVSGYPEANVGRVTEHDPSRYGNTYYIMTDSGTPLPVYEHEIEKEAV